MKGIALIQLFNLAYLRLCPPRAQFQKSTFPSDASPLVRGRGGASPAHPRHLPLLRTDLVDGRCHKLLTTLYVLVTPLLRPPN